MNKVIKTAEEYNQALDRLHALLDQDPQPGSSIAEQVELLALLIATYEHDSFEKLPTPTPIEAIRFRMEQLGLAQKDLARYLGSASRASEVLSGKRPLTLSMIRALSTGLGIPASLLIAGTEERDSEPELDWEKFPTSEMIRRGWIHATQLKAADTVRSFILPVLPYAASFRRTSHFRGTRNVDYYALLAWLASIWHQADARPRKVPTEDTPFSLDFVRDVVRLSWSERGPLLAIEFLEQHGIAVVVEPALPRTFLDGATLFRSGGPVIGLTLRFDRLDNFWYTLVHELAHIVLHSSRSIVFIDDLEAGADDEIENEADAFAREALIPDQAWRTSPASRLRSRQAAEHLARQLRISPAIVAGRIRREYNDYRVLNELVGHHIVRRLFPHIVWGEG